MLRPDLGYFLEVKSRTWSEKDAEEKSSIIIELINYLGVTTEEKLTKDYIEIVEDKNS
jgi:5-methylthioadenosine/S-adenosylhomocysteine deaminase